MGRADLSKHAAMELKSRPSPHVVESIVTYLLAVISYSPQGLLCSGDSGHPFVLWIN